MPRAKLYKMDAPTYKHLLAWCEREFPYDPEQYADSIVKYLQGMNERDAAYYLDKGWRYIDDEVNNVDD